MKKNYYAIFRNQYNAPSYLDKDLSEVDKCIAFDTEEKAKEYIKNKFNDGNWIRNKKLGKVRYYVKCKQM